MKIPYFVPNFPVNRITMTGEDGWCHMPNHPRSKYRYLDAVLEHIDNSKRIDPILIIIHDETQVHAGPSGVSRLFALMNIRKYEYVPAIVNSPFKYNWLGEGVEQIRDVPHLLSFFAEDYLPKSYSVDKNGAFWHNGNVYKHDVERSFKVSQETKNRIYQMIKESD